MSSVASKDSDPAAGLSHLGLVRISGTDRRPFLQGQITQDVERLTSTDSIFGGWTSPKGRLFTVCQAFDWKDSIWLLMPRDLVDDVVKRLGVYVLRSDVQIEESAMDIAAFTGTDAAELQALLDLSPGDQGNAAASNETHCIGRSAGIPSRFVAFGDLSGFESLRGAALDSRQWRLGNIHGGVPAVYKKTSELFVPQMINLELCDGISFEKGCYTGQEIVARTQNLGRIKRRMFRFSCPDAAAVEPAQLVFADGVQAGQVVDAVTTDRGVELLAVVKLTELGKALSLDESDQLRISREALPYDVPGASD